MSPPLANGAGVSKEPVYSTGPVGSGFLSSHERGRSPIYMSAEHLQRTTENGSPEVSIDRRGDPAIRTPTVPPLPSSGPQSLRSAPKRCCSTESASRLFAALPPASDLPPQKTQKRKEYDDATLAPEKTEA